MHYPYLPINGSTYYTDMLSLSCFPFIAAVSGFRFSCSIPWRESICDHDIKSHYVRNVFVTFTYRKPSRSGSKHAIIPIWIRFCSGQVPSQNIPCWCLKSCCNPFLGLITEYVLGLGKTEVWSSSPRGGYLLLHIREATLNILSGTGHWI